MNTRCMYGEQTKAGFDVLYVTAAPVDKLAKDLVVTGLYFWPIWS